jgi:hypothetical protein
MVERNSNTVIDLSFHFYKDTKLVEKSSWREPVIILGCEIQLLNDKDADSTGFHP